MKNIKQLFTALLLLCSMAAMAETVTIDGITYDVITKGKAATVIERETGKYSGSVVIPEAIVHNNVTCSVTSIGEDAFVGCFGLTSITIPNSVTTIGKYAFFVCSGLKEVHISDLAAWCNISFGSDDANPLFYAHNLYLNGELVTDLVIPNCVTRIKNYTFYGCSGLTSITIPNSVTTIGYEAFRDCSGLTSVTIGSGVGYIYSEAFANCGNLTDVYCLATTVPSTNSDAFNKSYPEYMTLHVPAESINSYKTTAPWSSFGNIVTLDGDTPETPKCKNPVIKYINGELVIECETENAEFITEVTSSDIRKFYSNKINFSATYNISVYAMLEGYENSDTVNATLCWIENGDSDEDDTTNIITVPAVAVLVTSANGAVTVNCSLEGESVEVYTTDGTLVGSAVITNGSTTIQSGLSKGSIAIVKIGNKSVKVVVD